MLIIMFVIVVICSTGIVLIVDKNKVYSFIRKRVARVMILFMIFILLIETFTFTYVMLSK
jgi:hypothetical protein